MVDKRTLDELIWALLRGFPYAFETCIVIQEAVSYPKRIPNEFWYDEKKGGCGILGMDRITKAEMKKLRKQVIARIIQEINAPAKPEDMYCDNYTRLFHALTLLEVQKNDKRIPAPGKDYMYNMSYMLWALDNGTEKAKKAVIAATWYSSEMFKTGSRYSRG
ncbi:MAG: hypothetical protein K6D97_05595 [Clostridia bacterium]|nr:hypothetical protein [Clostridia bacterium]